MRYRKLKLKKNISTSIKTTKIKKNQNEKFVTFESFEYFELIFYSFWFQSNVEWNVSKFDFSWNIKKKQLNEILHCFSNINFRKSKNNVVLMHRIEKKNIQILINMTMLFFIFVATMCRFLEKTNDNFRKRSNNVHKYDAKKISKQNVIYFFITNHLFNDHEKRKKKKLFLKFRNIVKLIIVLKISFFKK